MWERGQAHIQVQLTNRIVLNPYAAKRLAAVLNRVVAEYESKFGTLKDDAGHKPMQPKERNPTGRRLVWRGRFSSLPGDLIGYRAKPPGQPEIPWPRPIES